MQIEKYKAKSVIRKSSPSLFAWSEVYLNPYQGCFHDCKYCDGKSEGYYMHNDYADRIRVKTNAPDLLEQFLRKRIFLPINREKTSTLVDFIPMQIRGHYRKQDYFNLFIGGGVCDVYQPAEKKIKITRKLLQIAFDYSLPVFILTKNTLALRDLDLFKKINENSYACVSFTITHTDEKIQKIFEPRASTTQERFEAIKKLRQEGIHSGIYFYPVLPFIGDTDENMTKIYHQAKSVDAEFVYCWGLTLKPGRSKDEFLDTIQSHFPELYPKYVQLYSNNDRYGNLDVNQFKIMRLTRPEVKGFKLGYNYGLRYCVKRYLPKGRIETNLRAAETLNKIALLKGNIIQEKSDNPALVQKLYQTAKFLETYQKDIKKIKKEDLNKLPISGEVKPYIIDFIERGSFLIEELEQKAYNNLLKLKKNE
ncbi:MAG: radical SAM protein [Candidatus Hodarchaeota archaeon]